MNEKESRLNYLTYTIALVTLLVVATITIAFAYYKVDTTSSNTLVDISASLDCIDLKLSNDGNNLSLSYNYPISDTLAKTNGSITPVTVSVTNNCNNSMYYTLALSTLSLTNSTTNYIEDSKIRYIVTKNTEKLDNKTADYLSSLKEIDDTNQAYKDLTGVNGEIASKYPNYTIKKIYALEDTQSIAANTTNTYSIYLWVDYYEGDSTMYVSNTAIHDETYDGSTANKSFAAAISLSLNPVNNSSEPKILLADDLISKASSTDLWNSTLEDDGYRFVGTDPDNYICFGTNNKSTCVNDTDKYMYRIIGIFEDDDGKQHVKLIKKEALNTAYAWHSNEWIEIDWNESDLYKGLNGSYFLTNTAYPYMQDTTWTNKIATWNYTMTNTLTYENGGINYNDTHAEYVYFHELNRSTNLYTTGTHSEISGKISIMYASDYILSLGNIFVDGSSILELPSNRLHATFKTGWMYVTNGDGGAPTKTEWTMTRYGETKGDVYNSWIVIDDGELYYVYVQELHTVRPVFYLESNLELLGGSGKIDDPYLIS